MTGSFGAGDSFSEKNGRVAALAIVIALFCVAYVLRLFSMQVTHGAEYRSHSRANATRSVSIPAQRGEIFDRNATMPMVINVDSFAVTMNPGEIPKGRYDTVAAKLASFLGVSKLEIDKKIPPSARGAFAEITVKTNVPFSAISNIAENSSDLPGVSWASKPMRSYVETGSLSHIIGYVGDITQEELSVLFNKGYTKNSVIGKTGIEKQYDYLLHGTAGSESRTVDARGRVISDVPVITPPTPGKDLVLTIDSTIQALVEKTLGERVGAAVVLKPATGEILAMASYPYFDANLFSSDNASAEYLKLAEGENKPLLNRAVNAAYPPASTFKIIMSAAALNEKALPPSKKIECSGKMAYGGRTFHCHVHYGHGWLDMKNALAQSCDIYYWTVGRDHLGIDRIAEYSSMFGFGKSAEIDLPSQSQGFVPTARWKERRYHEKWLGGDTMSSSIGQGYMLATPLQVANMMAMVCNGGKIYKPHLLKEARDPANDSVIFEVEPEVLFQSNIDAQVWKTLQDDLRFVITDGTPQYPMRNKIVKSAGKTGTAEVAPYKDSWHSWMVAYAPWDAPVEEQVVVAMIVEAVNKWEWWSPYATNIILQGIFARQTYEEAAKALGFQHIARNGNRQE